MEISVIFEKGLEGKAPPAEWLRGVVEKALTAEKAGTASEVSLLIAGQEKVHELNRDFLGEDRPTDVLSFPMTSEAEQKAPFVTPPDGLEHLGEIIISLPQAVTQAEEHGHSVEREMAILIIHGVLHLLGYDHDVPEREGRMRSREAEILRLVDEMDRAGKTLNTTLNPK